MIADNQYRSSSLSAPIPSLDGLRAVAVILVVIAHSGYGHLIPGGFGVTIFFFLSGFLITTLLLEEFNSYGRINIKYFYIRRILRLSPPLLMTLFAMYGLCFAGLVPGHISWSGFTAQLLYSANYYILFGEHLVPAGSQVLWSLAIEEHFYILFPVAIAFLLNRFSRHKIGLIFILTSMLVLLWRLYLQFILSVSEYRIYYATDCRIDSILWGCVLAMFFTPPTVRNDTTSLSRMGFVSLGLAVGLLLFTFSWRSEAFRQTLRYTLQGIALLPLFYWAIKRPQSPLFRLLNTRIMQRIGTLSYSIYLAHFTVTLTLESYFGSSLNSPQYLIICLSICIIYALAIERFVESPFKPLRKLYHQPVTNRRAIVTS